MSGVVLEIVTKRRITMNEKNLELLEKIKDALSEIQGLREDLDE